MSPSLPLWFLKSRRNGPASPSSHQAAFRLDAFCFEACPARTSSEAWFSTAHSTWWAWAATHAKRDFHNPRLKSFCDEHGIPLADICSLLRDEHFGDELHPNDRGAKIIAEAVFQVLPKE